MEDKTQHCGASERAALPLLEGTAAEGGEGNRSSCEPQHGSRRCPGWAAGRAGAGARSGSTAFPRPGSAAAFAVRPRARQLPLTFQRPAQRIFLSPSLPLSLPQRLPVAAQSPWTRRVPGAVPPSAGGSSRCHFTPTSRRRRRRQLHLLNSRRSGGMKSSSPPPPRAAALRSRRGGGDGPAARPPEPRGALALPPRRTGRHSRGNTRARLPGSLQGAAPPPGAVAVRGALPRHGSGMGRSAPRQPCPPRSPGRPVGLRAPLRPPGPAPRPRRLPARPDRAERRGTQQGRPGAEAGAKGERPRGELRARVSPFEGKCSVVPRARVWAPCSRSHLPASGRFSARAPKKYSAPWDAGELLWQWPLLCAWQGRAEDRHCAVLKVTWACFPLTKGVLVFRRPSSRQHIYFRFLQSALHALSDRQACKEGWIPVTVHNPMTHPMCRTSTAMLVHK